ncbi:MAG: hypothetical protein R3C18_24280 [Planctomycetaceae bacterium]
MAAYKKYDARVDSLVVEAITLWAPDVAEQLGPDEKAVIAKAVHAEPQLASNIEYERAHTGFTRTITVDAADIERIYLQNVGG